MVPERPEHRQAIARERARLLDLLWQDILALRQLVSETQTIMEAARRDLSAQSPAAERRQSHCMEG